MNSNHPGYRWFVMLVATFLSGRCPADEPTHGGIVYGIRDTGDLALDIYHPGGDKLAPTIMWIHGGAWRAGDRSRVPIQELVNQGIAIASIDYRLSPVAPFPAQLIDIREAAAFLKQRGADYGLDTTHLVIAGASAGGHLAALAGVSSGVPMADSISQPESSGVSVRFAGVVSYYGAANLRTILSQSTPHGLSVRVPALKLLLGGTPEEQPELAKLASPVTHVDRGDPPLLLLHGDQDPQMPINQSHELNGAYKNAQLDGRLQVIHGAAHGGSQFYSGASQRAVIDFLFTKAFTNNSADRR